MPEEELGAYEKFKKEWRANRNLTDEEECIIEMEQETLSSTSLTSLTKKRRTSDTFAITPTKKLVVEAPSAIIQNSKSRNISKFKNKLEAISAIRLFMSSSMAEAYEQELRRRFNERQLTECVAFDVESVLIPAEMGSFRWKYSNNTEFLEPRLFVLDSEALWDEYIANRRFGELLQAYNEPNVFLYFINWKRACQKHTSALNRQFKQALNTSSETIQLVPANELENEFFLAAAQLRLQVNFSGAASAPQALVDLMDFVIEMTRVVALSGHLQESRVKEEIGTGQLNLTLARDVKVKSGKDARDCWIKILCQIPRVTPPLAESIASRYPSFYSLMEAYESCSNPKEGEELLAELRLEDGGAGNRRLGPAISARIYNHFY